MWMIIIAGFFGVMMMTLDINLERSTDVHSQLMTHDAQQVANGMLLLSNVLGNYLYKNPIQNGQVDLSNLPVTVNIDRRIHHVIHDSRLWIYTSENISSLTTELQRISKNSALICVVTNGRLLMLSSGADMNLTLPPDVQEGSVVYLN